MDLIYKRMFFYYWRFCMRLVFSVKSFSFFIIFSWRSFVYLARSCVCWRRVFSISLLFYSLDRRDFISDSYFLIVYWLYLSFSEESSPLTFLILSLISSFVSWSLFRCVMTSLISAWIYSISSWKVYSSSSALVVF
jgi:hypothetical protein